MTPKLYLVWPHSRTNRNQLYDRCESGLAEKHLTLLEAPVPSRSGKPCPPGLTRHGWAVRCCAYDLDDSNHVDNKFQLREIQLSEGLRGEVARRGSDLFRRHAPE